MTDDGEDRRQHGEADGADSPGADRADGRGALTVDPVGVVHTPFSATSDAPRQGFIVDAEGTIELAEEYASGLDGVEPGDRVVVVWYADGADRVVQLSDGRGVFGTRSPARPNPVCITTVEVLEVDRPAGRLRVRGVDMRDGTPVLDLKRTLDPDRDGRIRPPGE